MKFLVDMNLSPLWVPFFARHEIKAVHWSTIGLASAPDSEIFKFAAANGYIVFTQDGISSAIDEAVIRAIGAVQDVLEEGALVTLDASRQRVRILPI